MVIEEALRDQMRLLGGVHSQERLLLLRQKIHEAFKLFLVLVRVLLLLLPG